MYLCHTGKETRGRWKEGAFQVTFDTEFPKEGGNNL